MCFIDLFGDETVGAVLFVPIVIHHRSSEDLGWRLVRLKDRLIYKYNPGIMYVNIIIWVQSSFISDSLKIEFN